MDESLRSLLTVTGKAGQVKLYGLVELLMAEGRWACVGRKEALLQEAIDARTAAELGRRRGEPKRRSHERALSQWRCSRCGSGRQIDLSYGGSYWRRVVFAEGEGKVRIPRIRCVCGGSVPPDFGWLLPKRQRYWHDLHLTVIEQYAEGFSYRGVQRWFQRRGVFVGLGRLPQRVAACRDVGLHARPEEGALLAIQADGAYWRVGDELQAILHVLEVRPREEPGQVGRHALHFTTGQVLASLVASGESTREWAGAFGELKRRGWVTEEQEPPLFLTSDGNGGLVGAAEEVLGFPRLQRCTWHIGYRAREDAPTECRTALENAVHHVFNAPDPMALHERFGDFVARWRSRAPKAVAGVARKLPEASTAWFATDYPLRPRTAALAERHNLEYKRRLRPTRGLARKDNLEALVRLLDLRHNCIRQRGADWLHQVAVDLFSRRVKLHHSSAPPSLPPPPTATAYTTGGT